jgi:alkylation response protein AidB-like acyl-CoA dehydrogenase
VSLDLELDDAGRAIADAVAAFARDRCPEEAVRAGAGGFAREPWQALAELGILALVTPEGDGGALELAAAMESLGTALFPGPLAASFFATQVLPEAERGAVARGEALVSLAEPPLLPFGCEADVILAVREGRAVRLAPRGTPEPVGTLGGEPWGRAACDVTEDLGDASRALTLHDLALACYLAAAARQLVDVTAEHVRTRKQFGRAVGEFQAVAHPLADCAIDADGAASLARAAAFRFDADGDSRAGVVAAAARLAATRAAVDTAHACHQLFGAVGITLEGPVFHVSRRILQLASQPPALTDARERVLADWDVGEEAR